MINNLEKICVVVAGISCFGAQAMKQPAEGRSVTFNVPEGVRITVQNDTSERHEQRLTDLETKLEQQNKQIADLSKSVQSLTSQLSAERAVNQRLHANFIVLMRQIMELKALLPQTLIELKALLPQTLIEENKRLGNEASALHQQLDQARADLIALLND